MKTYDETIRAVFDGRDKILKEQQQKKKITKQQFGKMWLIHGIKIIHIVLMN